MNESSIVLYQHDSSSLQLIDLAQGSPASVDFDFQKVWAFKKRLEDFQVDKLHFIHIHPTGAGIGINYSATDDNCLRGLALAFGKAPGFHIAQFANDDIFDFTGQIASYAIKDAKIVCVEESNLAQSFIADHFFQLLKLLAYT